MIEKNRAQLAQAEVELRRYEQLLRDGATSAELVDRRRTIRSTAQANLDEAMAERQTLVAEVYDQLRRSPQVSKAAALQAAQIKLIRDRRYRHPCYWSPYLIIGNWL